MIQEKYAFDLRVVSVTKEIGQTNSSLAAEDGGFSFLREWRPGLADRRVISGGSWAVTDRGDDVCEKSTGELDEDKVIDPLFKRCGDLLVSLWTVPCAMALLPDGEGARDVKN
jgi:hypothetical protein